MATEFGVYRSALDTIWIPTIRPLSELPFSKAAGPDGELSEAKFETDAKSGHGFVRKFDKWFAMLEFDKNDFSTINWDEANAYRMDLRDRTAVAFDANGDGKLTGGEREAAIVFLVSGKVPEQPTSAQASTAPVDTAVRLLGPLDEAQRRKFMDEYGKLPDYQEMLKAYDKNHDGVLSKDELRQAAEDRDRMMLQVYDADHNGVLSRRERAAARADVAKEQERLALVKYDANHDGKLDSDEQMAYQRDMQEQAHLLQEASTRPAP